MLVHFYFANKLQIFALESKLSMSVFAKMRKLVGTMVFGVWIMFASMQFESAEKVAFLGEIRKVLQSIQR